jgi:hypothetical protein
MADAEGERERKSLSEAFPLPLALALRVGLWNATFFTLSRLMRCDGARTAEAKVAHSSMSVRAGGGRIPPEVLDEEVRAWPSEKEREVVDADLYAARLGCW